MSKQISQSFNIAADKVVSLKEWRQKTNAHYNETLTTSEKVFLNLVDKPLSVAAGLAFGLKAALSGNGMKGAYFDTATSATYVNGAYITALANDYKRTALNQKFQNKINSLAVKAFDECEDYSQSSLMQRLKPL